MFQKEKKTIIFWLLIIGLIVSVFFWNPTDTGREILRYMLIGNILFIMLMSGILHFFFRYRHRKIMKMLQYIAQVYDNPLDYSYTPVTLIRKRLHDNNEKSYLKETRQEWPDRCSFTIVHQGQDCDFVHHLHTDDTQDWASVLIYYLEKDIPYEILYEHSKYIHTALTHQ